MNKVVAVIVLLMGCNNLFTGKGPDALLAELDQTIRNRQVYMDAKEQALNHLKQALLAPSISVAQTYQLHTQLSEAYKTYIIDSAIAHEDQSLRIATTLNNPEWIVASQLKLSYLYAVAGMYVEALHLLNGIGSNSMPENLKSQYFDVYKSVYSYYAYSNLYATSYRQRSNAYRDSLLAILSTDSTAYQLTYAEKLLEMGKRTEAKTILLLLAAKASPESHDYAIVTYVLGSLYQQQKNVAEQQRYYTLSAIADIKNAIKENTSLRALAISLYEAGDIERAYTYIRYSLKDAIFSNARLRTMEIAHIFPIIDAAYQEKASKQRAQLLGYLALISILSACLLITIIYVSRQMKKVARQGAELKGVNSKLAILNGDLNQANARLQSSNLQLSEANRIKEEYIGNFLDICSTYINKLEDYQKVLNNKATANKMTELLQLLKSTDLVDQEVKALYKNFDLIFLRLYPDFVGDFNALLLPGEQLTPKPGELTSELRIFALVRLGITDGSRIAGFLRYSMSTIYNYRTKVRNKAAVPKEDFEEMVRQIGLPTA